MPERSGLTLDAASTGLYADAMAAVDELKNEIEARHGGRATFVRSVPVHHSSQGKTLWNGAVQVFDLAGTVEGAKRAYAWSQGSSDGKRRLFVVIDSGTVTGPREAVRTFIAEAGGGPG